MGRIDGQLVSASVRDALLAEVQRIAGLGGFVWTTGEAAPIWSDEFFRILGYEPGSVSPSLEAFSAAVHPEDLERVQQRITAKDLLFKVRVVSSGVKERQKQQMRSRARAGQSS